MSRHVARSARLLACTITLLLTAGCGSKSTTPTDGGHALAPADGGTTDGGTVDAGTADAGTGSPLGANCTQDSDCGAGPAPQCLQTPSGNGYCSSTCTTDNDCPTGTCEMGIGTDANGNPVNLCLLNCLSTLSNCSTGDVCEEGLCVPACVSDMDCGTGSTCDVATGECSTPGPDAGIDAGTPEDAGTSPTDAGAPEDAGSPADAGPGPGQDAGPGTDAGPAADAGEGSDAGIVVHIDAGPGENLDAGVTGAPCAEQSDCTTGTGPACLVASTDAGYCSSTCHSDRNCPDGVCVSNLITGTVPPTDVCLRSCTTNADCATGSLCESWVDKNGTTVSGCWLSCGDSNDCGNNQICDTSTGACTDPIGNSCQNAADCTTGKNPVCFPSSDGDESYCSSTCTTDADCAGGVCVSNLVVDNFNNPVNTCLASCSSSSDCLNMDLCESWTDSSNASVMGCWFACETDEDCGPAQTCNTNTGVCH